MSLRVSLVLVTLVSLSSIVVTFFFTNQSVNRVEGGPPFFYTLPASDIRRIEIDSTVGNVVFELNEEQNYWFFKTQAGEDPLPVNLDRWGGVTTLLGGPRSQRSLLETFGDPSLYGLDSPDTTVTLNLRDGSSVRLLLGDQTSDRDGTYAQIEGFPQLVLVSSAWGEVLTGLVEDPPTPQWLYDLDVSEVTEATFLINGEVVGAFGMDIDNSTWSVCDLPLGSGAPCVGSHTVDADKVIEPLKTFAAPQYVGVQEIGQVSDEVQARYGLDENAPYVTVRFEIELRPGLRQANQVSMTIGNLTPDGKGMYALGNEQPDVLIIDAEWGQKVLDFFGLPAELAAGAVTPAPGNS